MAGWGGGAVPALCPRWLVGQGPSLPVHESGLLFPRWERPDYAGYGDIVPWTTAEVWVTMLFQLMGVS